MGKRIAVTSLSPFDVGWLAGFIDGEGSVTLNTRGSWRRPGLCATSTDIELVTKAQLIAGGTVVRMSLRRESHKPNWNWTLSGAQCSMNIMSQIVHYMSCPKKVARIHYILTHYPQVTTPNGYYTPKQLQRKQQFEVEFFQI